MGHRMKKYCMEIPSMCVFWRFTWIAAQLEASPVDVLKVGLIWLHYLLLFMVLDLTTHSAALLVWAMLAQVAR